MEVKHIKTENVSDRIVDSHNKEVSRFLEELLDDYRVVSTSLSMVILPKTDGTPQAKDEVRIFMVTEILYEEIE